MLALGPEIQVWKAKGIPSPVRKFISLAGTNVNSGRNLSWEGAEGLRNSGVVGWYCSYCYYTVTQVSANGHRIWWLF